MAPADKSPSPESPKREAGGGCPPPNCSRPPSTRYNSPNADCASTASPCCSSQCRYPQASSHRASSDCHPCALKSILKNRSTCQCDASRGCLCQPIPRGCNCPPPIQVDARAAHECSCECPSSPECACPPSERRFPKTTVRCPNARICCPSPRLPPPSPKCYCPRCQPCPPPPSCGPCTPAKCRRTHPPKDLRSPCPSCPPCRPNSTVSPCRPPTPCRKLTFCTERSGQPSSPCTGQSWRGIIGDKSSESSCSKQNDYDRRELYNKKYRDCCYAADCAGSEIGSKYTDKNHNLILNEGCTQNSGSKIINLSETTNPSRSVDPDSHVSEESDETVYENAAEALEGCTIEKSSKDSWYTLSTHAL